MNGALHMVVVGRRSLVSALAILAALVLGSAGEAAGAADRKAPTAPRNLRVTGSAHYSVSLAWDASTDNSGFLTYWIQSSNGYRMSVPMSRTSATLSMVTNWKFAVSAGSACTGTSEPTVRVSCALAWREEF